ncbi:MAG: BlaI/MecI/CopY family transcriptional regulator [Candidatus Weimeria sp.]
MHLSEMEERVAELIWEMEPVTTQEMIKVCEERFGWKKSTTYTELKRLENKGIVRRENSSVTSVIKKDEYASIRSQEIVQKDYYGSLPAFISSFTKKTRLSKKDIAQIRKLLDEL